MVSDGNTRSWRLTDAAVIAAANPCTLYKPSLEAIALLRVENSVKLIFAFESNDPKAPSAERMWVRIKQVEIDDPVPDPTKPYRPQCSVSHRVLKEGVRVGYLYRELPDCENDSGWRMMAGDESDEYQCEAAEPPQPD